MAYSPLEEVSPTVILSSSLVQTPITTLSHPSGQNMTSGQLEKFHFRPLIQLMMKLCLA